MPPRLCISVVITPGLNEKDGTENNKYIAAIKTSSIYVCFEISPREYLKKKNGCLTSLFFLKRKRKAYFDMRFWISAVSSERVSSFGRQTPLNISANFN